MNYTKPEVAVLGKAISVIEANTHTKAVMGISDLPFAGKQTPAYDLDE
jgi:hypothetical protein